MGSITIQRMKMNKSICLTLPEGDQVDLEIAFERFIESLNIG